MAVLLAGATGYLFAKESKAGEWEASVRDAKAYTNFGWEPESTFIRSFPKRCRTSSLGRSLDKNETGAPGKAIVEYVPTFTKIRFKSEFEDEAKTLGKDFENGFCSAKLVFRWSLFHVHSFGGSRVGGGYATRGPPFGQFLQSLVEIQRKGVCV